MKLAFSLLAAALAGFSAAVPVQPRQGGSKGGNNNQDVTILQFALTLEHLENVFYKQALSKFKQEDFTKAGFRLDFLPNLKFLAEDEQSHVQSLSKAIQQAGQTPVAACEYNFPYTDVQSFVTLSAVLEGVGTSAYLGAAPLVSDKTILTTAGSILVTESLHTSQQRGSLGQVPAANALGTPVTANGIFTLASQFIKSCPQSNAKLPFKAFPTLTQVNNCPPAGQPASSSSSSSSKSSKNSTKTRRGDAPASPAGAGGSEFTALPPDPAELADLVGADASGVNSAVEVQVNNVQVVETVQVCNPASKGQTVELTIETDMPKGAMVTIVSGLTVVSVNINKGSGKKGSTIEIIVPDGVSGQTFVFVTKGSVKSQVTDNDVVAGPAVVEIAPPSPVLDQKVLK